MPDTFTQEQRSAIMRAVRSTDTRLEQRVRSSLWRAGLRFRKNVGELPGTPDIVFSRRKLVVFVDSCFWHGCPAHLRRPQSNQQYWSAKIARNIERDRRTDAAYQETGWHVIRVWEHDLKSDYDRCISELIDAIRI